MLYSVSTHIKGTFLMNPKFLKLTFTILIAFFLNSPVLAKKVYAEFDKSVLGESGCCFAKSTALNLAKTNGINKLKKFCSDNDYSSADKISVGETKCTGKTKCTMVITGFCYKWD